MSANTLFPGTQLASVQDDKPVRLTIDKLANNEKLWLTKINGGAKPNFQIMNAIGGDKFLNTFQQRLRVWNIQGIYAMADCNGPVDTLGEPEFLRFYRENNISAAQTELRIAFSGITIKGYLVDLKTGDFQQDVVDGYQFNFQFLGYIPGLEAPSQGGSSTDDSELSPPSVGSIVGYGYLGQGD